MNKQKTIGILSLIIFVGSIVWGISYWSIRFMNYTYPYTQNVDAYYYRASTTNDLNSAANYLQKAYDWLDEQNFDGNPNIIFPTPKTDWELVMSDLADLISTTRTAVERCIPGDDAYQEALKELDVKIYGEEEGMDGIADQTLRCYEMEYTKVTLGQIITCLILMLSSPWFIILITVNFCENCGKQIDRKGLCSDCEWEKEIKSN